MLLMLAPLPLVGQESDSPVHSETNADQNDQSSDKTEDSAQEVEAQPDQDKGDFKPREEISEDFPVPLPADI